MGKSNYRHFSITIAANAIEEVFAYGRFLTMLDDTATTDTKVSIGGDSEETLPKGLSVELPQGETPFTILRFHNQTGVAITVTFALSSGRVYDSRLTLSGSVFDSTLAELQGDTVPENWGDVAVGLAAVSIVALNANRKSILIQADPTNTGVIYIGYDNTTASNKKIATLSAGQIWAADDYRGVVWAIASAAAQSVSYSEL